MVVRLLGFDGDAIGCRTGMQPGLGPGVGDAKVGGLGEGGAGGTGGGVGQNSAHGATLTVANPFFLCSFARMVCG